MQSEDPSTCHPNGRPPKPIKLHAHTHDAPKSSEHISCMGGKNNYIRSIYPFALQTLLDLKSWSPENWTIVAAPAKNQPLLQVDQGAYRTRMSKWQDKPGPSNRQDQEETRGSQHQ